MNGKVYGPYTGRYFETDKLTDIEHIVATSEGHDSGLCSASNEIKRQFSVDPLNLTLAASDINRCNTGGKCGKDAGEWMPPQNRCWFVKRVMQVKSKYKLSIDETEKRALKSVFDSCDNFDMIFVPIDESNFISTQ
ncbi:GmrSD restriction endonuclease domain-containing protein [Bacterioplanoides sp.]|uniref:GmrSD restriction endonuclease domain-containing protein n=1 Tax=Bacterioplanoides sp. TaxID=2066072 RepID=UPI003B5AD78A